jgi:hypothetical protein
MTNSVRERYMMSARRPYGTHEDEDHPRVVLGLDSTPLLRRACRVPPKPLISA